jgi:hypothetical protein
MNEYKIEYIDGLYFAYVYAESFTFEDATAKFFIAGELIYTLDGVAGVELVTE